MRSDLSGADYPTRIGLRTPSGGRHPVTVGGPNISGLVVVISRGISAAPNRGGLAEALAPLRAKLGPPIREREVLRVAAAIEGEDQDAAGEAARRAILSWAQEHCGGDLPERAWQGETFDYIAPGRTTLGVRLATKAAELWALRGDDPDKRVPRRVWTTEVTIGRKEG